MVFDFLRQFPKRMKKVGAYAVLMKNSMQKGSWKNFHFSDFDEQINLLFSAMLYIMEESLKEVPCTIDDIGNFLDQINMAYFKKPLSYEECKELAQFIVNIILSNDGSTMYFNGFDFELGEPTAININFVGNKIVYLEGGVKRTSYFLTEDGYDLLLSTLEVEAEMQLTIQEMIFKLHIERSAYDKAVEDIRQIFNLLRIQCQKIEEAMNKIRKNALTFSTVDYGVIVKDNLMMVEDTNNKLLEYRQRIAEIIADIEEKDISVKKLNTEEIERLGHLRQIESYLNRSIDEYQRILNSHFDLKNLYDKELEDLTRMTMIKRFNLRTSLYDEVLKNPSHLEQIDGFLRALFVQSPTKIYNINKSLELQKPIRNRTEEDDLLTAIDDYGDESYEIEQKRIKLEKYRKALKILLEHAKDGGTSLYQLKTALSEGELATLLPTVGIFKEIMLDLLQEGEIDVEAWRREQEESFVFESFDFRLSHLLLDILTAEKLWRPLKKISIYKAMRSGHLEEETIVTFSGILGDDGRLKTISCSNVIIEAV